jgi:hypothetical protein
VGGGRDAEDVRADARWALERKANARGGEKKRRTIFYLKYTLFKYTLFSSRDTSPPK